VFIAVDSCIPSKKNIKSIKELIDSLMKIGFDCMVVTTPYLIGVENSQKSVINQMGSDRVIPVRTPVIEELVRTIQQTEQQLNRYLTGKNHAPFPLWQHRIPDLLPEHLHTNNSRLITNFSKITSIIQAHANNLKDVHQQLIALTTPPNKKDREQKKTKKTSAKHLSPTQVQHILLKAAPKSCHLSINDWINPQKVLRDFCGSKTMQRPNDAGELSIILAFHQIAALCLQTAPAVPCHFVMFTGDKDASAFLTGSTGKNSENPLKKKILRYDPQFVRMEHPSIHFYAIKPNKPLDNLKDAILANTPHSFTR
jgi:hypothetical protein